MKPRKIRNQKDTWVDLDNISCSWKNENKVSSIKALLKTKFENYVYELSYGTDIFYESVPRFEAFWFLMQAGKVDDARKNFQNEFLNYQI